MDITEARRNDEGAYAPRGHTTDTLDTVSGPPRIVWSAVFAGVVVAVAVQVLLGILGTGIGASTIDPLDRGNGSPSASAFGMGAGIWWAVSSLVALFIAGWIAGRLSWVTRTFDAVIHGLVAWALATIVAVYLLASTAGSVFSGAASVLGTAATVSAAGAAAVAPQLKDAAKGAMESAGVSWDDIKNEARALMRQTGKPGLQPDVVAKQAQGAVRSAATDPQATAAQSDSGNQDILALLDRLFQKGKDTASQVDRDAVINVVMARTGVSREEATKRVAGWEETYQQSKARFEQAKQQAEQKAREAADATAKAVSRAAIAGFFALLLGAIAAMVGGAFGRVRDDAVVRRTVVN